MRLSAPPPDADRRSWLARRLGRQPSPADDDPTATADLLALVQDVICVRDAEGIVLFASPAAPAVLGIAPADLVGAPLDLHLHPDDRLAALAVWQRLLANGSMPATEFRWLLPSGAERLVEMKTSALPARGGAPEPRHFGTVIRDISDQRQLNTALQDTRDELAGAVAAGPGVLYRLTPAADGRWQLAFISSNVERMTGFSVAEATAMIWPNDTLSDADIWRRWRAVERTLDHGAATVEYDMRAQDTSSFRVVDHLRRRDRADGTVEIIGYLQEVTEERAMARKLELARQDIDTLTHAGPGLLYRARADASGARQILSIADNVERITGFTAEEVTRPGWFAEHCDAIAQQSLANSLEHLDSSDTITLEFRFKDRAGPWRWVRDSIRVVAREEDGMELVGYWTDITRERELASQLAQAGKLALLGELATAMTHELRHPLATINLATESAILALQNAPCDISEALAKLDRILEQVQRSARLIDHMRIFGRHQDGTMGEVDLGDAVEGAATIMAGRLKSAQIELWRDLPEDLPTIHGQSIPIEQVLINLFANACDAYAANGTSPELRRIEVAAKVRGSTVVASITDHAGGIPDAIIDRVFEPFFTTKLPNQGTGLGLSISYGIVRDLGGMLSVRNVANGARFELQLPLHSTATDASGRR